MSCLWQKDEKGPGISLGSDGGGIAECIPCVLWSSDGAWRTATFTATRQGNGGQGGQGLSGSSTSQVRTSDTAEII